MLHLMRAIDKVTGYVFIPPPNSPAPPGTIVTPEGAASTRPNAFSLLSTAAGPTHGPRSDVRDVQERWIDARVEYDAWESAQWRREGQLVQEQKARAKVRMRGGGSEGAGDTGSAMERNGPTEKPQHG
jgi:GPN-loop GTPase